MSRGTCWHQCLMSLRKLIVVFPPLLIVFFSWSNPTFGKHCNISFWNHFYCCRSKNTLAFLYQFIVFFQKSKHSHHNTVVLLLEKATAFLLIKNISLLLVIVIFLLFILFSLCHLPPLSHCHWCLPPFYHFSASGKATPT